MPLRSFLGRTWGGSAVAGGEPPPPSSLICGPASEGEAGTAAEAAPTAASAEDAVSWAALTVFVTHSRSPLDSLCDFRRVRIVGLLARICAWRGGARRRAAGMVTSDTESRSSLSGRVGSPSALGVRRPPITGFMDNTTECGGGALTFATAIFSSFVMEEGAASNNDPTESLPIFENRKKER